MGVKKLGSRYYDFWESENKKLIAHPDFFVGKGTLFDDAVYFNHKNVKSVTKIDFSILDCPHVNRDVAATLYLDGLRYSLSAKEYGKLFFVAALPEKNIYGATAIPQMIEHIFAFLNASQYQMIDSSNVDAFWESYLIQSVNENGFYNRLSPPSYSGAIKFLPLAKIRNHLKSLGVIGVIDESLTQKKIESKLDDACRSTLNITLNEYRKGGSFNFLGLELGQYYIDYLRQNYQQDYLYTIIYKKTLTFFISKYGLTRERDKVLYSRLLGVIVSAMSCYDLQSNTTITRGVRHNDLFKEVKEFIYSQYLAEFDKAMSLNEKCIEELALKLGLGMRFDVVEVIRILMLQKFHDLGCYKSPEEVWTGYISSLEKSFLDIRNLTEVHVDEVYSQMDDITETQKLSKIDFLRDIIDFGSRILERGTRPNYRSFRAELNRVFHSMLTLVAAWLGYRKSEFGFPLEAIHIERNQDILDNSYIPFRFKLKWIVPKTNKSTKINREITSQCYQIAVQLNDAFSPVEGAPCLYEPTFVKETKNESGMFIEMRVKSNWEFFVLNYQPFIDAMQLDSLHKKDTLDERDIQDLEQLSARYRVGSARYTHLLTTAVKVRQDWDERLRFTSFKSPKAQRELKASLESYIQTGEAIDAQHQNLFETYLSDVTKSLLRSRSVVLDTKSISDLMNELLEGVRYPSCHSLRHVWAEAVLTRYQGDVGAVIQHQFCHLDNSFFMAYLRDKDARGLIKVARQRYLNSIVEMLLLDADKIGEEYLGGFARYVKKAKSLTRAISESEVKALRETINSRIITIEPSPFAICVPREGSEKRAKCAKFGSINPQDAKPEFCLHCVNSVITKGHIRGIWEAIQPMVKEALNKDALGFMLENHLPTLRSGYKRIRELQSTSPNKEQVGQILSAIENSISAIEFKLEQDRLNYGSDRL